MPTLRSVRNVILGTVLGGAALYGVYQIPGTIKNLPYAVGNERTPEAITFGRPLVIDRALLDKGLNLITLDPVTGSIIFNTYSVKNIPKCDQRLPKLGENREDTLRKYRDDCEEARMEITIPFLTANEVDAVKENLYKHSAVVLKQPVNRINQYPSPVGPRSADDYSVVGTLEDNVWRVVADKDHVIFFDGIDADVVERFPVRKQLTIVPEQ